MVTHGRTGSGPDGFSPQLAQDVAQALNEYLLSNGPEAEAQLHDLTNRVCQEAHALGLPPEKMLIAIKRLFERAPLPDFAHSDSRRSAFERFISGCIKAYFDAK
ncbi:MAG: hypothetical protein ABI664_06770 [bacterium]